jgi:N-acetylneuraminic acid mutarotase
VLFGGEKATGISSNLVYIYDTITKNWSCVVPNIDVPKLDSHSALVVGEKMMVYGGYISDKAEYLKDIYAFDLNNHTWHVAFRGGKGNEPCGRSNFPMLELNENLLIFGGTDGAETLNDMWIFDTKSKEWKQIETKDTPDVTIKLCSPGVVTRWSSTKTLSSCSEEFRISPRRRTIFTYFKSQILNGVEYTQQQILSMIAHPLSKKAKRYLSAHSEG